MPTEAGISQVKEELKPVPTPEMAKEPMVSVPVTETKTEIKAEENLKPPTPTDAETPPLNPPLPATSDLQNKEDSESAEEKPQILFKSEVEESPEEILKKRIAQMEVQEKKEIEEHKIKEAEEAKNTQGGMGKFDGSVGALPKYQELFKSPTSKLPPLPPLPKFEAPKQSGNLPKFEAQKPSFLTQTEEKVIPQPPQLAKKAKVEFVPAPPPIKTDTPLNEEKIREKKGEEIKATEIKEVGETKQSPSPDVKTEVLPDTPSQKASEMQSKGDQEKKIDEAKPASTDGAGEAKMTYEELFGNDKT
ncbi:MAG: hypothetical protein US85_C0005G0010 [Candidatus Shapirobacteria bacterium GW2011_GWF1_38_23]|nr:MAG: hypothetical protein US85_C0005G0010 [Candidatus Shapirobacteria bacterium GW2011_GWF1_38_23]